MNQTHWLLPSLVGLALLGSCASNSPTEGTASAGRKTSDEPQAAAAARQARARISELRRRSGNLLAAARSDVAANAAIVELPASAAGSVRVKDRGSAVAVAFSLRGASDAPLVRAEEMSLYAGALDGNDVLYRRRVDGTEDFVFFDVRPSREELVYEVDVSRVPGVRLVANTLEFLDDGGAPRLRVAPPYLVDARGARHEADLSVSGCAYDASPRAPWGRAVTPPGSATCTVRVLWGNVAYPAVVDPAWVATGSTTTPRSSAAGALLPSGKVLLVGGVRYDDMGNGISVTAAELYDETTGTFAATGAMGTPRCFFSATTLGSGKVLAAAGTTYTAGGSVITASAELYDPATGFFTPTGSLLNAREAHEPSLLPNGRVLLVGGRGPDALSSAELYDPTTGSFTSTGSLLIGRHAHTAKALPSGKVLVAGGLTAAFITEATAEIYDPATGSFALTGSMSTPRHSHTASVLRSGKVLVAGGDAGQAGFETSAEIYDPATGSFSVTGSMFAPRFQHVAPVLASGKVLLAGDQSSKVAELYDPVTGKFTQTTPTLRAWLFPVAAVLPSGRVLLTGDGSTAEILQIETPGAACVAGDDCSSGICEDGVCCAGACSGSCKTCAKGTGACVVVTNAEDPDTCAKPRACDATGTCKAGLAQPCSANDGCASAFCADGICCDAPCTGGCDSCNLPGTQGTCSVVSASNPGAGPSCAPYLCDGKRATCPASCAIDDDCVKGNACDASTHTCAAPQGTCDGDHLTTGTNGATLDCVPYKCASSGSCKHTCISVDDCAAPNACDPTGHCVTIQDDTSGGCSASPLSPAHGLRGAFVAAVGLVLVPLLRRRRRSIRDRR